MMNRIAIPTSSPRQEARERPARSRSFEARLLVAVGALALVAGSSGCYTFPPRSDLERGRPDGARVASVAWLAPVELGEVPGLEPGEATETFRDAFTARVIQYLWQRKCFRDVRLLPGEPAPDDVILRLRIDRYAMTARPFTIAIIPGLLTFPSAGRRSAAIPRPGVDDA